MKKYMFLLAILSIFQVGCYEDKGNYDYTTVDEVTIEGEYELVYRLKMGERLSIPITLELNGFDESQLEFKWEFAIQNKLNPEYHLLSTSKDFDEEITLAPAVLKSSALTGEFFTVPRTRFGRRMVFKSAFCGI